MPAQVKVGGQAQAPFKAGCRVTFEAFQLGAEPVANFRSGDWPLKVPEKSTLQNSDAIQPYEHIQLDSKKYHVLLL